MRKLSQKELVREGVGDFIKNTVKGSAVLGGRVLKGLAKAASPTATDQLRKFGKAFKDTDKAVIAATTPIDQRIDKYFKDMGYNVNRTTAGADKGIYVVQVSEIGYDDDGSEVNNIIKKPYVIRVEKSGIKILRGPRTPVSSKGHARSQDSAAQDSAAQTQGERPQPAAANGQ